MEEESAVTTLSNQRQVGGTHYKRGNRMQHWDMVHEFGLDYFQGQITKYLFRHTQKGGVEDLEKAKHYLEKYIELNKKESLRIEAAKVGDSAGAGQEG